MTAGILVTVQPGETLASISKEFDVPIQEILSYNKNSTVAGRRFSENDIRPGDQFYIRQSNFHDIVPHGSNDRANSERAQEDRRQREREMQQRLEISRRQQENNTNDPTCVAGQANCNKCFVDVVHINVQQQNGSITHKFVPITADEQKQFEIEEKKIAGKLQQYYAAIAAIPANTPAAEIARIKREQFDILNNMDDGYGNLIGANEVTIRQNATPDKNPYSTINPSEAEEVKIDDPRDLLRMIEHRRLGNGTEPNRRFFVRNTRFGDLYNRASNYIVPTPDKAREIWFNKVGGEIDDRNLTAAMEDRVNDKGFFSPELKANLSLPIGENPFVRQSLHEWNDSDEWVVGGQKIQVTAEAQFFRFSSNGPNEPYNWYSSDTRAETTFTRKEIAISIRASFQTALMSGERKWQFNYPQKPENGHLLIKYRDTDGVEQKISLGFMRFALAFIIKGFAGASLLLGAEMKLDIASGFPSIRSTVTSDNIDDKPGVRASAFAGIRAGIGIEAAFDWIDKLAGSNNWKSLAKAGAELQLAVGIGGDAQFKINFVGGRFYIVVAAEVVFGAGASGKLAAEVDLANIGTMIHFMYNALLQVDFHKIEIFDGDAFDWYCNCVLYIAVAGVHGHRAVVDKLTDGLVASADYVEVFKSILSDFVGTDFRKYQNNLANWIIQDAELAGQSTLLFSPPEAKGRLLYNLTRGSANPRIKQAIARLLECSQGSRDFVMTVACMNKEGKANDDEGQRQKDLNANFITIGTQLKGSQWEHMNLDYNRIIDNARRSGLSAQQFANQPIGTGRLIADNQLQGVIHNDTV